MVTAPAKRELVRWMGTRGLSARRCLGLVGMSASALRYEPRADCNQALRERIVALAQRHRRYGGGMIYLKLRQAAIAVNYTSAWSGCIGSRGFISGVGGVSS
jgi:putative transposase